MLSLLHPEVMAEVRSLPMGLLPIRVSGKENLVLAIKAPKEMILAAKVRQGFKFYVAPLPTNRGTTAGLVTAFFDDADEPLVLKTLLFDDDYADDLRELLSYETIEVYFFDEHCREWISVRASIFDAGSCLTDGTALLLFEYAESHVFILHGGLDQWFGQRTAEDDARAISVNFTEALAPDDIFVLDATVGRNDYLGSKGYHHAELVRKYPGPHQERDIALALGRTFPAERIALNPFRVDTDKELADAVVLSSRHLLIIQAKDSPNTEASLSRTLDRKRRTSAAQLSKGVGQVIGAAKFAKRNETLVLSIDGKRTEWSLAGRSLFCLVVLTELFSDSGTSYVEAVKEMEMAGLTGLVFDYPTLHAFTHWLREPVAFMKALQDLHAVVLTTGNYPNLQSFLLELTAPLRAS